MSKTISLTFASAIASLLLLAMTPAQAALATRTWVSGVGDDLNPCTRTAPCKTFAGAILKTAANGEIGVLDPGDFGPVTITQSISIVSVGQEGGILAGAIQINAGSAAKVNLDGLIIEGAGTGSVGIHVLSAGHVYIRNSVIRGFDLVTGIAIFVEPSSASRVFVTDTDISRSAVGINARSGGGGVPQVVLDRVKLEGHLAAALVADGAGTTMYVSNSNISFNKAAFTMSNGGVINSYRNNVVAGNNNGLNPSAFLPLK